MKISSNGSAIVSGWVAAEPKYSQVGSSSIPKTSFALNACVGKDAPLVSVVAWRELAGACRSLKKKDRVLVAGTLSSREYNGKTYTDLTADFVMGLGAEPAGAGSSFQAHAQQLSMDEMKDISPDEIPF